jgi:hypothetical protein
MNDHDAMTAINAVLEQYFRGQADPYQTLTQIAQISGANKTEHEEQK